MIKLLRPADIVSMTNACFGFLAIFILILNDFISIDLRLRLSFSFILLALLADGLDGIVARKTSKGKLGEYFEAMADFISMGIAPLIFIYMIYKDFIKNENMFFLSAVVIIFIFYLMCAMIRLSAFHPLKNINYFLGLPASASAIILIVLAYQNLSFIYLIIITVIVSILMISKIKFIKPNNMMNLIAAILIIFSILFGKYMYGIFPLLLISVIVIYLIIGPFVIIKDYKIS